MKMNKNLFDRSALLSSKFASCPDASPKLYVAISVLLGGKWKEFKLCENDSTWELSSIAYEPLRSQDIDTKSMVLDRITMESILYDLKEELSQCSLCTDGLHTFKIRDPVYFCIFISDSDSEFFLKVIGLQASADLLAVKKFVFDRLEKELDPRM